MQWLAQICVRRPVFAGVLMLVVFVLGMVGYTRLGLDQFPNIDLPIVVVTTTLEGADPSAVESEITDKIEAAVNTIDGIDEMRSTSSEGFSQVAIAFKLDKAADVAAQDVRDKIEGVLRDLPRGIDPPVVSKVDPQASPVLLLALRSELPIREVTEIADKRVRRQIESISGVGRVDIVGGRARQIHVLLDPIKLRAFNVTAVQVQRALAAQNVTTPGGSVDTGPRAVSIRVDGRVSSLEELSRIVLSNSQGQSIRVGDVALVEDAEEDLPGSASYDGHQTVILSILKQAGTNTVQVVDNVLARTRELERTLPSGVKLEVVRDNSSAIRTSIGAVKEHLVVGAVLAALVVLLFLGSARSTLIAAISIPISIVGTFALMWMKGFSLNLLTLLALALAVGIVIDDAIVVLENIVRFIEQRKMKPFLASVLATREVGLPVLATTLSLMAVFVPVAFVGGIPGRFLENFGYTMAFAVGVSLLVSFALTPTMCARLLEPGQSGHGSRGRHIVDAVYLPIERVYMRMLRWSMSHRWAVVLACCLSLGSCGPLLKSVPSGFLPADDQAQFEINLRSPEGTSASQTALIAERVAQRVRALEGVAHTVTTVAGGDARVQNLANIYVSLSDPRKRTVTQEQLMDQTRKQVLAQLPSDLRSSVSQIAAISSGSSSAAVRYVLKGPDPAKLEELAAKMSPEIKANPAVVDFDTNLILGKPDITIKVDRERAADLGISVADIADTLRMTVAGVKATSYSDQGEEYEVRLRAAPAYRRDVASIALIGVPSSKHGTVPLSWVVSAVEGTGPSQINRLGRQRQVTFMANVARGFGESDVIRAIQAAFEGQEAPPEYSLVPTGMSKSSSELAAGFIFAFAMSFVFMYLILAAQFESWLNPIIILISLPLTVPFALLSLKLFDQGLNLMSALGLLVLFGVVKKNAILQIDHTNQLRALGHSKLEAILEANRDRLRPILMTTIAFVAGMVPLALSRGIGSGNNRNISGIVIGGQTLSLLLTLVAVPVVHSLFDDAREWLARRRSRPEVDRGERELMGAAEYPNAAMTESSPGYQGAGFARIE